MANPNVGQTIAASWNALVSETPEDNIFVDYWLLNQLKAGKGFLPIDGGDKVTVILDYAQNGTVTAYNDTETISTSRQDVLDTAEYTWKQYAGSVVHSELEKAINQGSAKKTDLLAAKLKNLKSSIDDILNQDLFSDGTGTSAKVIGGLAAAVPLVATSGTFGGINRATFAFWRTKQTSGAKTTSAYDNLRATMRSIYNQCSNGVAGNHPKFGVTDRTTFEGYEGLLLANERFTDKGDGDGGFKNEVVKFKGMKLAYDGDCTSGYVYFLNPEFVKLAYAKGHWYKGSPAVEPANQTIEVFKTHTICNLVVTNSRMLGVVTGIT
jgi:hypothetical protein